MKKASLFLLLPTLLIACQSTDEGETAIDEPAVSEVGVTEAAAAVPDMFDPEVMQAEMLRLATPGEMHAKLEPMIGEFACVTQMWMGPDTEPSVSEGTCTNRWIMDGRFVEGHFTGNFMGMPFEGRSIFGYDNGQQKYVGFSIDNFGTMMMPISEGQLAQDGKLIEMSRTMIEPTTNQEVRIREELEMVSPDAHRFRMYMDFGDGNEFQNLDILYTRVQG